MQREVPFGLIIAFSKTAIVLVTGLAWSLFLDSGQPASAQSANVDTLTGPGAWAPGAIAHAQKMRNFRDADLGTQATPAIIPKFKEDYDSSGKIATFQPGGPTFTALNPFFQNLGANGRTCFTCHQPQEGWTVGAAGVQSRFNASGGTDPIFRLVDGATCPTDDVSTLAAKRSAYKLLTSRGLIRIGLPMPRAQILQFEVTNVKDPYHCTTNPNTGLTSATTGIVSVYRRPLPSANLGFLSTIMWDGREPNLASPAKDATLIHAQSRTAPTTTQQQQMVAVESGFFVAQSFDSQAHNLNARGATGGPVGLFREVSSFFIGINDPFEKDPKKPPFDPNIFNLYKPWRNLKAGQLGHVGETEARKSVARGEEVFNTTKFDISGVPGLNDEHNVSTITGFCGTCHNTPDAGNQSVNDPMDIGIADAKNGSPPALDISGLPVFTLKCKKGPLAGQTFVVTDPGRALITGQCKDIGKIKTPSLRGLAARAPYFHNGSGATLFDTVNFYEKRFGIFLTFQQTTDLINFLGTL